MSEPGYREVPGYDDPPEYEPDDVWQDAAAEMDAWDMGDE